MSGGNQWKRTEARTIIIFLYALGVVLIVIGGGDCGGNKATHQSTSCMHGGGTACLDLLCWSGGVALWHTLVYLGCLPHGICVE